MIKTPLTEQTQTDPALPMNLYYKGNAYQGQPGLVATPGWEMLAGLANDSGTYEVSFIFFWGGTLWAGVDDKLWCSEAGVCY